MRRLFIGILLFAGAMGAVGWLSRPKPIPVVLTAVEWGKVEASVANTRAGSVEACQRTRLSTIAGGRIAYLGVKEGDRVKKGQVLLRLWNDDQRAQSGVARTQVDSAGKKVDEVCALVGNAEREAARLGKLRGRGYVAEDKLDEARTAAMARRAACEAAKAEVRQAQAREQLAEVEQGRTVLIAPFDGTVANIVGELGEYTTPSPPGVVMPPAIDLIDDSCLYVSAPMDEVDAPKIRVGQAARITLDALPKMVFAAHVRRVAPYVVAVEKQARTVEVEADFDVSPAPGQLLVGYSADLEIVLEARERALRIPSAALSDGNRVLVYREDSGKLEERTVQLGVANWEYSEVLAGLAAGDRIVATLEREGVRAGVRVVPE